MARRSGADERQTDFFGVPVTAPSAPKRPIVQLPPEPQPTTTAVQTIKAQPSPPPKQDVPADNGIDTQMARLSSAELSELVASLPDSTLAHLVIVTIRQLRRRLARNGKHGSKHPTSVLERAAQQLVTELGEYGDYEDS